MAHIGLIDVDGHNYPNLALMKLSAWHKAQGDTVEWWWSLEHYERVYMAKVFDDTYTPDVPEPANAELTVKGGTGYVRRDRERGLQIYRDGAWHDAKSPESLNFGDVQKRSRMRSSISTLTTRCTRN